MGCDEICFGWIPVTLVVSLFSLSASITFTFVVLSEISQLTPQQDTLLSFLSLCGHFRHFVVALCLCVFTLLSLCDSLYSPCVSVVALYLFVRTLYLSVVPLCFFCSCLVSPRSLCVSFVCFFCLCAFTCLLSSTMWSANKPIIFLMLIHLDKSINPPGKWNQSTDETLFRLSHARFKCFVHLCITLINYYI